MQMRSQQPRRGLIGVASHFNGWYQMAINKRAFRYATTSPYRVPTARRLFAIMLPAIEMAGYHYLMPTASVLQSLRNLNS